MNEHDEQRILSGVRQTLTGLSDIMEALEPTVCNSELWVMIREAEDKARERTKQETEA